MKEYGRIGQKRWEGQFYEEFLPELSGMRGIKVFQEMKENDDTVGAILFVLCFPCLSPAIAYSSSSSCFLSSKPANLLCVDGYRCE